MRKPSTVVVFGENEVRCLWLRAGRGAGVESSLRLVPKPRFGNRHPETLFDCWVRQTPDIGIGTKSNEDGLRVRTWLAQLRMSPLAPPVRRLIASLCFPAAVEPWPALRLIDDGR
jgi:hypothetical protein